MQPKTLTSWLIPAFFLILAGAIQTHILLERDVIYLANAASMMLKGGTYLNNFFETNPPMIFFLYLPAVFLNKMTALSLAYTMPLYCLLLSLISMMLCYHFLTKIFKEPIYTYFLLASIAFTLLLLPASQFSQREHLLVILVLPYLFCSIIRLENKPVNMALVIIVGLFAGLGFAIKPHFLTTLCLVEIYFIYARRSLYGWIRIETIMIMIVMALYLFIVDYFFQDYLKLLLPFIYRNYLTYIKCSWLNILTLPIVDFCLFIAALSFFIPKVPAYRTAYHIFFLALVGFILSFMLTRTPWYYHTLPALSLACLLGALIALPYLKDKTLFILVSILLFAVPGYFAAYISFEAIKEKKLGQITNIIQFFSKSPPTTLAAFSLSTRYLWATNYTNVQNVGRFSLFWWQPKLLCGQKKDSTPILEQDKRWIVNLLVNDLVIKKPEYILVDIAPSTYCNHSNSAYIKEFSRYKNFQAAWKPYRYVTTLSGYDIYRNKT